MYSASNPRPPLAPRSRSGFRLEPATRSRSNLALQLSGLVGRRFAALIRSLWRPQLSAGTLGGRGIESQVGRSSAWSRSPGVGDDLEKDDGVAVDPSRF
jgi:hypothetical protein